MRFERFFEVARRKVFVFDGGNTPTVKLSGALHGNAPSIWDAETITDRGISLFRRNAIVAASHSFSCGIGKHHWPDGHPGGWQRAYLAQALHNAIISAQSATTVLARDTGRTNMIRTVALGVVFLAGAGAIGPVARDKTPKSSGQREFPVAVGTRADRLTIRPASDSDVPNTEEPRPSLPEHQPVLQVPATAAKPKDEAMPAIASRHWHDPTDLKPKKMNHPTASRSTWQLSKQAAGANARQVVEAKECRSDGLYPLLRKMNLSPPCN